MLDLQKVVNFRTEQMLVQVPQALMLSIRVRLADCDDLLPSNGEHGSWLCMLWDILCHVMQADAWHLMSRDRSHMMYKQLHGAA